MTDAALVVATSATEPDGAPRLPGLDILRGVAILGILFMNINDMGASFFAVGPAVRHLGWSPADRIAWFLREVLADGTARCMLEMLFGVGMVILTDRAAGVVGAAAEQRDGWRSTAGWTLFGPWPVMRAYYWRSAVLYAFGLVHLFVLLWPGDILHTYAIAAMIAFLFRRLPAKTLLFVGLSFATVQLVGNGVGLFSAQRQIVQADAIRSAATTTGQEPTAIQQQLLAEVAKQQQARDLRQARLRQRLAAEDRARSADTGTPATWVASSWHATVSFLGFGSEPEPVEFNSVIEALCTMLIGAALFRWGVIQGEQSRRFYLVAMLASYAVGISGRIGRALFEMRFESYPSLWYATYEPTRLATSLGHLCLIWLLLGTPAGARLLRPFAAAGQTALSIYLAQTLICLWVLFPPWGLALYGRMSWAALMLVALAIDAVLLLGANWWVRRYRIAPVEWAWRSILAGRRLPIRRDPGRAVPVPAR